MEIEMATIMACVPTSIAFELVLYAMLYISFSSETLELFPRNSSALIQTLEYLLYYLISGIVD